MVSTDFFLKFENPPRLNVELAQKVHPYVRFDLDNFDSERSDDEINDVRKLLKEVEKHIKGTPFADAISQEGQTLYQTVTDVTPHNWFMYIGGYVTEEDIVKTVKEGLNDITKRYNLLFDIRDDVKHIQMARSVMHHIQNIEEYLLTFDALDDLGATVIEELDDSLRKHGVITITRARTIYEDALQDLSTEHAKFDKLEKAKKKVEAEFKKFRETVEKMDLKSKNLEPIEFDTTGSSEIPSGKMVWKKASEVFPVYKGQSYDPDIPYFEWEGEHPMVPKIDENYVFRPNLLRKVLYSIITNKRLYLRGHTGTGKTTLIEQACAYMNYPFVRFNFDSEAGRADLIGRDTLTTDDQGNTISKFIDGTLPTAMQMPCIFCADEIDFVRPDISYVMQAPTEGKALRIPEDGDRMVVPHPMFRLMATGNTVGQGDEHGMYQGARPQSMAFLDRFTVWAEVPYLSPEKLGDLVKDHFPLLDTKIVNKIIKYSKEHMYSFENDKCMQPLSPRGVLAVAEAAYHLGDLKEAFEQTILDKASGDDRSTLIGLIDRVT